MSESSDRGKNFELLCRREAQRKLLGDSKRDRRSGAGELYKSDIVIPAVGGVGFHVECKSQERMTIPAWWAQTMAGTHFNKVPMLVFEMDVPMALMRYDDLLDLLRIIQDDTKTISKLRNEEGGNV